jgi:hypothetical protein
MTEKNEEKGYVWMPYIVKTTKTTINGETVWYANKWKNFLLKIKHFFIKPKHLKSAHIYSKKTIDPSLYETLKIDGKNMVSVDPEIQKAMNEFKPSNSGKKRKR